MQEVLPKSINLASWPSQFHASLQVTPVQSRFLAVSSLQAAPTIGLPSTHAAPVPQPDLMDGLGKSLSFSVYLFSK